VRTRHGGSHKILEEMETSKGSPATCVEEETKAARELTAAKKMEKKGWAASYSRGAGESSRRGQALAPTAPRGGNRWQAAMGLCTACGREHRR
jgi:hypothetical protein